MIDARRDPTRTVTVADETIGYRSYLLRLWRVKVGGRDLWRASLQDPQSGERISFATVEALFAYLQEQLEETPSGEGDVETGARAEPGPVPTKER
jgi:hypothetical protein